MTKQKGFSVTRKGEQALLRRFNLTIDELNEITDFSVIGIKTCKEFPNVSNKYTSNVINSSQTNLYYICKRLNIQAPIDNETGKLITFYYLDGSYGYKEYTDEEIAEIKERRKHSPHNKGFYNN